MRTHLRNIPKSAFDALPDRLLSAVRRSAALLRIAVLLHRSHEPESIPVLDASVQGNALQLLLDQRWLDARPLLRADLEGEPADIAALGIELRFDVR